MAELRATKAGGIVRLDAGRALRSTQAGALVRCRDVAAGNATTEVTQAGALVRIALVEMRATQAAVLVRIALVEIRATQAAVLVRVGLVQIRNTQVGALVRIALIHVRASQVGALVRTMPPSGRPRDVQSAPGSAPQGIAGQAAARGGGLLRGATGGAAQAAQAWAAPGTATTGVAQGLAAQASPAVMAAAAGPVVGLAEKRVIAAKIEIDWGNNGTFIDESANLISAKGSSSLMAPQQALSSGKGQVDRCTVQLHNLAFRYSTLNEDSPLAAYIGEGLLQAAPVRVSVTIDGTTYRLFTGVIRSMQEEAPTPSSGGMVTLDCRSRDDVLLQQKLSTELADWLTISSVGRTEDWHLIKLLEAAGLVDGTDFVSQAYAAAHSVNPTIDNGVFPLRYVWLDDASPLETVWQVAAACCGWFYADADGKVHYHNLAGLLDEMLAQQYGTLMEVDITDENSVRMALSWKDNDLFSEITVAAKPLTPAASAEVWTTEAPVVLEPGQSKTFYARLSQPQVTALTLAWSAKSANGDDITATVSVVRTDYAQRIKLAWTNSGSRTAYVTATLTGQILTEDAEIEVTETVDGADTFWASRAPRTRRIANAWVQGDVQAATVARYVLDRSKRPQLVASITNLDRADVRVGRRCNVRYPGVMGDETEFAGLVMSSSWSLQTSGFRQSVEIFDVTRLFASDRPFFVLGTNKLGASGTGTANLFY